MLNRHMLCCTAMTFVCMLGITAAATAQTVAARPALRDRVDALIRASGNEVAVAFSTLDGRETFMLNEDTVFHAASTMKVPVMVELFRRVSTGSPSLDERVTVVNQFRSVVGGSPYALEVGDDSDAEMYKAIGAERSYRDLCESMITISSNLATNVLIDRLGAERVSETMRSYGAEGMVVRRGVEDTNAFEKGLNNTATARGFHTILMAIAQRQAVSADASAAMIEILKRQTFRNGIPAGVPPGTAVAHKTGTITRIHHDGGIVFGPRPYVLVVLTRGFPDEKASDGLIASISTMVYESVSGSAKGPGAPEPAPGQVLRYDRPTSAFEEALPLGNGRMGATIFGHPQSERIMLNESSLWAGGPIDPAVNPGAIDALPKVREALFRGDYALADQLTRKLQGRFSESYAPLGDLFIDAALDPDAPVTDFNRELDLGSAVARTAFTTDRVSFTREYFVSHPDRVLVVHITASKPGALAFALRAGSQLRHDVQVDGRGDLVLSGRAPIHAEPNYRRDVKDPVVYDDGPAGKGMRFAARARLLRTDGQVGRTATGVSVSGATEAIVAIAVETSFTTFDREPSLGPNPSETTAARLDRLGSRSVADLRERHLRDYRALFGRVSLDLGRSPRDTWSTDRRLREYAAGTPDPGLEALYFQYGRYLLISSSRPGGPAANLQGIWNPHLRPPWSSNYTVNINTEMNYWPAETTNLAECHEPLLRFISDLARTGAVTARHFYGCGGWCVHHNSDIWALSNPVGDFGQGSPSWANWPLAGAWFSLHLWDHYAFGGDRAWLRDTGYPLIKGAAEFALDWLVKSPDGYLVTAPSTSPENVYKTPDGYAGTVSVMTTADLALVRGVFLNAMRASEHLGTDAAFRAKVKAAFDRLPPYKIGSRGHLQEWYLDWQDQDPEHRHVSHLIGLYPDSQITPQETPELAAAVKRSLELRGDGGTGWSKAWKIALWARLLDGDHAYRMLRTHLRYVSPTGETQYQGGGTYPNLFDAHPPFQIDGNFGGTAGMAEMLLQSHRGEIHLLPALPSAWSSGAVRGLRARGGFTVDEVWRGGALVEATVLADQTGTARIRYGQLVREVALKAGIAFRYTPVP